MKTYQLIVSGLVQGVNYRKFVLSVALTHRYKGFVRNLFDGSVEVIMNAEFEEELEFFISKLYEGSLFSEVSNVLAQEIEMQIFEKFEVR